MRNNNMKNPSKVGVNNNNYTNKKTVIYDYPKYSLSYKATGAIMGKPNERNKNIRNDVFFALGDVLLMSLVHLLVLYIEKTYEMPYRTYDETYVSRFVKSLVWNLAFMFIMIIFIAITQKSIRGYRTLVFLLMNIVKFYLFKMLVEPIDVGL